MLPTGALHAQGIYGRVGRMQSVYDGSTDPRLRRLYRGTTTLRLAWLGGLLWLGFGLMLGYLVWGR